jgi:hypothetical protein
MDWITMNSGRFATNPAKVWSARSSKNGQTLALPRLGDAPRFLDRLGLYDRELPFIAVPISVGGTLQGVLAVQPDDPDDGLLRNAYTSSKSWPT